MLHRVLDWALVICIGAVFAMEAVGQASPQTPPVAPDMSGWNRVSEMRDGQRIIVTVGSGIPMHCVFRGITDHSLFCDSGNLLLGFNKREIARDDVTWLRTDNYPRDRGIVMGVLGGAGVVLGAASPTTPDTGALRAWQAALLGGVGAGVGYVAAIPIALFLPGKTIYAQPMPPSAAHLRWPRMKYSRQPIEPAQTP
jgi:hypothetical protein